MEDHHPAVLTGHIGDDLSGLVVTDNGSLRDLDDKIIPIGAVAALFAAGLAVLRAVLPLMAEIHQRIQAVADLENDVAAPAAVTAVRPSGRDKQFPAEADVSVAAVSRLNKDFCTVLKHKFSLPASAALAGRRHRSRESGRIRKRQALILKSGFILFTV